MGYIEDSKLFLVRAKNINGQFSEEETQVSSKHRENFDIYKLLGKCKGNQDKIKQ